MCHHTEPLEELSEEELAELEAEHEDEPLAEAA